MHNLVIHSWFSFGRNTEEEDDWIGTGQRCTLRRWESGEERRKLAEAWSVSFSMNQWDFIFLWILVHCRNIQCSFGWWSITRVAGFVIEFIDISYNFNCMNKSKVMTDSCSLFGSFTLWLVMVGSLHGDHDQCSDINTLRHSCQCMFATSVTCQASLLWAHLQLSEEH